MGENMDSDEIMNALIEILRDVDISDTKSVLQSILNRFDHEELQKVEKILSDLSEVHSLVDQELTRRWWGS